jgi:maltooligosyltrehalose trehalohydrolase
VHVLGARGIGVTPPWPVGATPAPSADGAGWRVVVWAPNAERVAVRHWPVGTDPADAAVAKLERLDDGYHAATVQGPSHGDRYRLILDDGADELPDPASRWQPEGVHGPSAFVDPAELRDGRPPAPSPQVALPRYVLYELHVGTFTEEGTFDAAIPHLDALAELGVTAIEIMPVAQFPGRRNWGYDGVFPYAAQDSYGGPHGLARLVDACHERGLAVVLDVVYNHLGPEGNVLSRFGPYFTDAYSTPWGDAVNVAGPDSDAVRRYFVGNALWWLDVVGVDALRLDAIHGIVDPTAVPFLAELGRAVRALAAERGRCLSLIAESSLHDVRVVRPEALGGLGLDAQWDDDFHHALRTVITGEREGYYADYGTIDDLATVYERAFVLVERPSAAHGRRHGNDPTGEPGWRFVVSTQNHDQVGNRKDGDRPSATLDPTILVTMAAAMILSPFLPMLFMGEEHGETAPFRYFVDHTDPELLRAVREGRAAEFAGFSWQGDVPDPGAEETFVRSRIRHDLVERSPHREIRAAYAELLRLRRSVPALASSSLASVRTEVDRNATVLTVLRLHDEDPAVAGALGHDDLRDAMLVLALGDGPAKTDRVFAGRWELVFEAGESRWGGDTAGSPRSLEIREDDAVIELPRRTALLYLGEAGLRR